LVLIYFLKIIKRGGFANKFAFWDYLRCAPVIAFANEFATLRGLKVLRTFKGLPPLRSGDPLTGEAESKKNTAAV
jgi:hypothetical protein